MKTYTVTVVREAAAPPTAIQNAVWSANLTVGVAEIAGTTNCRIRASQR